MTAVMVLVVAVAVALLIITIKRKRSQRFFGNLIYRKKMHFHIENIIIFQLFLQI